MTTTRREPRSKKRSWGLVRAGMGDRSRFPHEVGPGPEDHQGIEHHEAFPQVHVREVEPALTVLTEIEEADEADEVDGVDGERSGEHSFAFLGPGSGEREDRGPEQDGDVDTVAAVTMRISKWLTGFCMRSARATARPPQTRMRTAASETMPLE